MIKISKQTAKSFLHQKLIKPKFNSAIELLKGLEAIQIDPVAIIERNHQLTASLRMPSYSSDSLEQVLSDGEAFEYYAQAACLLPVTDYPLFADVRQQFTNKLSKELFHLSDVINVILSRLANEGPLPSSAFASTKRVQGGWDTKTPTTKESSHALQLLFYTGKIQVVQRKGSLRFFSRTEDSIPSDLLLEEQFSSPGERAIELQLKYARAYRLFSHDDPRYGWQKHPAQRRKQLHQQAIDCNQFTEVLIEGIKRPYTILTEDIDMLLSAENDQPTGIEFLSPLDPLLWRRERLMDVYNFYYRWEIYVPESKRAVGPYGMPILWDGELIGQISPYFERSKKMLWIHNIVLNQGFQQNRNTKRKLDDALHALAIRVGATSIRHRD
ncbi:DNA glycosylase AlkZ-like family protein [Shouchella patagoniensis]|uniref:DNA glycosylase AlkZ-like family protein n=1 Tax=Shouchella patagoniensis TaxID=228576 RepID=UPI001472FF51|nr:winged helix DNA-binding domain-containing protein [Shouchella patagoniensis]